MKDLEEDKRMAEEEVRNEADKGKKYEDLLRKLNEDVEDDRRRTLDN